MLLDATFLVDLLRGDEAAIARARAMEEDLVQQRLSSMTLFELFYGVARAAQPEEERRLVEDVLASKPTHAADGAVMRQAGRLAGELANRGEPVADGDVVIGATAAILDEPVRSPNVDDFESIGVEVVTY